MLTNSKPLDHLTTIATLQSWVDEFVHERNWEQYHSPKNLAVSLSIEAAELLEHFQWTDGGRWRDGETELNRPAAASEMADVLAYLLRLASVLKIDLSFSLQEKLRENAKKYPV
jgi:dCTP diphosphatase